MDIDVRQAAVLRLWASATDAAGTAESLTGAHARVQELLGGAFDETFDPMFLSIDPAAGGC